MNQRGHPVSALIRMKELLGTVIKNPNKPSNIVLRYGKRAITI